MKILFKKHSKRYLLLFCLSMSLLQVSAQTDIDGLMMSKNNFCVGPMYTYSSWKEYWEGTFKRDNANLGTVSSQMFSVMGNYGITDKLNVLFGLPYIKTKASQGTLHGQEGIQDLSLWVKWMPIEKKVGKGLLSVYGLGGLSFPVSNYVADMLPLSIGLGSTNITFRGMVDYQLGDFFATGSASYVLRSNVDIDRTSYYTEDELILSDEVDMPNAAQFNLRVGYRTNRMIAEAVANNWTTLGGFDMTKNNMPFPSNKMNATTVGINLKYNLYSIDGLSFTGGGNYVVAGRNVGQATTVNAGIFYILNFTSKKTISKSPKTN